MSRRNVDAILTELGWEDGFRIPVANEENRRLEEEIEKKVKYKASLSENLARTEERAQMLKKHAKNLKQQQNENQKLLTAHLAQVESEDHIYRLSTSTESSLRQEACCFEKEWKDVDERVSAIEKELVKITNEVEAAKRAVEYDEKSLSKWEEVLNQKEENKYLIEQFLKQDAKKYKELVRKQEKLSIEVENYRRAIVKAVDEVHELEVVLDRTAKLYEQALKERRQMINQWTQSVTVLRQRDKDVENCLREIEALRELGRDKTNALQEAERFFNEQITNNKQLDDSLKQSQKKLVLMKDEHQKLTDAITTYTIESQTQKKYVEDLARQTQEVRVNLKRKKIEIHNKRVKAEDWKKRIDELRTTVEEIENQKFNIEDKTKQMKEMIEQEERRKRAIAKEHSHLQAAIMRSTNRIAELESERIILQMQKQNELKKTELLATTYAKEKELLQGKEETLYHVLYNIQKRVMKLERLKGIERDKSETEKKQKTIEELETAYAEKVQISKLLQSQITSLEHDSRKIVASLANDERKLEQLKNKKRDLVLLMDGGEKRLKDARIRNEERQVEENILRLKVSHLERIASSIGEEVYSLEKYLLQLEAALRERKAEITAQSDAVVIQKRIVAHECSEIRAAISERRNRIRQLQARYDNGIAIFGSDSDGAPLTMAYLKVQHAQEKYILQQQGDTLDETIRKTEQEIRSMENTLRIVNACNDKYKDNLSSVNRAGPEQKEHEMLEEKFREVREDLENEQIRLQRVLEDVREAQENYTKIIQNMEKVKEEKENKERSLSSLMRQIEVQQEKLLRAEKNLRRVEKDIRNIRACSGDVTTHLQETDVALRLLQEQNVLVLQDIAEFTIRHVEAEVYVKKLLAVKHIELPCVPFQSSRSTTFSRCGSNTSSAENALKSTSCSAFPSSRDSRENIGSILNLTASFSEFLETMDKPTEKTKCNGGSTRTVKK